MVTVTLLGTAATMPLPDRALTTALLAWEGHSLLFDCGEGTQAASPPGVGGGWPAGGVPASPPSA